MAQMTSKLWKSLWRMPNTEREYKFEINGVEYGPDQEVEHSYSNGLFEDFGIGNAYTASLKISLFADNIPKAATIKRYVRLKIGHRFPNGFRRAHSSPTAGARTTAIGRWKPMMPCVRQRWFGSRTRAWNFP